MQNTCSRMCTVKIKHFQDDIIIFMETQVYENHVIYELSILLFDVNATSSWESSIESHISPHGLSKFEILISDVAVSFLCSDWGFINNLIRVK